MKPNPINLSLRVAMLWLCLISLPVSGSTIFWGSRSNDALYDSAGNTLTSSFSFEIGNFDTSDGWTPTSSNVDEWSARWRVFDAAVNGAGWDPTAREVNTGADHTALGTSTSIHATPSAVFAQSTQAYLWVYNSKAVSTDSEWALVLDTDKASNVFGNSPIPAEQFTAWQFPSPTLQSGESFDWQTRDLDTAIFGGVNGVQGDGIYSVNPGVFTIQTHVVPEPGSALLILAAGAAFMRRRRALSHLR